MNTRILISIASTTLLLAACGGRDDPVAAVPTTAEAPASEPDSFIGLSFQWFTREALLGFT